MYLFIFYRVYSSGKSVVRPASADPLQSAGSDSGIEQTNVVKHESVQKVSKARAMFENLSTTTKSATPKNERPKLKSW